MNNILNEKKKNYIFQNEKKRKLMKRVTLFYISANLFWFSRRQQGFPMFLPPVTFNTGSGKPHSGLKRE